MNTFFSEWYTALHFVAEQAILSAQLTVIKIDPHQESDFDLDIILAVAAAGVAAQATVTAGQAVLTGLQRASGVAMTIWPSGTKSVWLPNHKIVPSTTS